MIRVSISTFLRWLELEVPSALGLYKLVDYYRFLGGKPSKRTTKKSPHYYKQFGKRFERWYRDEWLPFLNLNYRELLKHVNFHVDDMGNVVYFTRKKPCP